MIRGNWGNFIKTFSMKCNRVCVFLRGNGFKTQLGNILSYEQPCWRQLFGRWMKRKVKKQVEDRKLEGKIAGWGQYCWVRLISVHSLGRQSVRVPTIGSWSGWQHGQSWAAFASVPGTEGQAYWEAVWWTQWVRQTCCINRLFAAVARNKP